MLILLAHTTTAQVIELKLASDVWPPFTNEAPNTSFAMDLVNESLKRSGIGTTTEIIPFNQVMQGLEQENYDGSAALWYTEKREESMLFSAPYLQNRLIVVGRRGENVSMTSFEDLKGKKVAIVGSYAYGSDVEDAEGVILVAGDDDQQNLDRLLQMEVDYMLVDALLMEYLLTHQKEEVIKHLQVGSTPLVTRSLHFAIRRNIEGAQSIIERFNQGIVKMISDGTYNRILQLNWIKADVDGDGNLELVGGKHTGKAAPTSSYDIWFDNSSNSTPASHRYYVDGEVYQGWDNVPQQYKVQPISERPEDFKLMKFNF